jgi:hypothetical protein
MAFWGSGTRVDDYYYDSQYRLDWLTALYSDGASTLVGAVFSPISVTLRLRSLTTTLDPFAPLEIASCNYYL